MGFEPTTFSLARRRSTTELHPLMYRRGYRERKGLSRKRELAPGASLGRAIRYPLSAPAINPRKK